MSLCQTDRATLIRRRFLQVGFSGFFGFGTAELLAGRALAERSFRDQTRRFGHRSKAAGQVDDPGLPDRRPESP